MSVDESVMMDDEVFAMAVSIEPKLTFEEWDRFGRMLGVMVIIDDSDFLRQDPEETRETDP